MGTLISPFNKMNFAATPSKAGESSTVSKVRVVVRVRQFLPQETSAKGGNPVSCASVIEPENGSSDEVTVFLKDHESSRNECYNLDAFYGQEDNNVRQIFKSEVSPLVPGIFHGLNATVFAYGATGSGKTYTMQGTDEFPGLIPLAMSQILSMCEATGSKAEISYYEVYMDRCYDLLELKTKEIAVLDDKDGKIHLKGLSRVPVNSMSEFYDVFSRGVQRRKVAHTGLNDVSSRSHGVIVISVCSSSDDGSKDVFIGKINLIDLAGNEDNRRTGNEGIRLLESAKINQSLFALSNVIHALNNNLNRVPYRESRLTRILQDSLGGTSRALMVACLNPGEYQESVHTVRLAARSRHISNFVPSAQKSETPKVKVDMEEKLRAWLESRGKTKSMQKLNAVGTPVARNASSIVSSAKNSGMSCYSYAKLKTTISKSTRNTKERTNTKAVRIVNNQDAAVNSFLESLNHADENDKEELTNHAAENYREELTKESANATALEPNSRTPDEVAYEQKIKTSPGGGKGKPTHNSPLRNVLSPINNNIDHRIQVEFSSADKRCPDPFASPHSSFSNKECSAIGTPLDKFNAHSSSLKTYLVQEYVNFLNTASREELQEIKGIGRRTAEYIVDLRESSPLKSLSDLEKIGLSSKQVYNLFSRGVNGMLWKPENATPSCS